MGRKVVINVCHGGFGLSHQVIMKYSELTDLNLVVSETDYGHHNYWIDGEIDDEDFYFDEYQIKRDDPDLIEAITMVGIDNASGQYAELKIVEIPSDIEWTIQEYDGLEWVAEAHRTWS